MHWGKAAIYLRQSNYDAAKATGEKMMMLDSSFVGGLGIIAISELSLGNFEESLKLADQGIQNYDNVFRFLNIKIKALQELGRLQDVKRLRDELLQRQETNLVPSSVLALAEYNSGNTDEALSMLERAFEDRDLKFFPLDPRQLFEKLNGNPLFDAIWEKVGLPELKK